MIWLHLFVRGRNSPSSDCTFPTASTELVTLGRLARGESLSPYRLRLYDPNVELWLRLPSVA